MYDKAKKKKGKTIYTETSAPIESHLPLYEIRDNIYLMIEEIGSKNSS